MSLRDIVAAYIADGLDVVPISSGKAVTAPDWTTRTFTLEDFTDDTVGVGVKPGRGREIVDIDDPRLSPFALRLLPNTEMIDGRPGKSPGHLFYDVTGKLKRKKYHGVTVTRADGTKYRPVLVEIISGQAVLPPTPTETGPREWIKSSKAGTAQADFLSNSVIHLATAGLLGSQWPAGSRHDAALAAAGFLIQHVDARTVEEIIAVAAEYAGDDEVGDRRRAARDTAELAQAPDAKVVGLPTLAKYIGQEAAEILAGWYPKSAKEPKTYAERVAEAVERERIKREAKREVDAEERPPYEMPPAVTLDQRLILPVDPITWRIEDLLPLDARAMLAAQFKAGKTTFVVNVVRCLADGDDFLGRYKVTPVLGRIGVLDFEMSARQLDAWYRDQQIRRPDRVVPIPLRGAAAAFDIRLPDVRATWVQRLRELDVEFLIIDCLRPIMDGLGLDEHRDAGLLLTAIDSLIKDAGISGALIVHHMGHNGERSRGDSRLRDWPDVEWRLVRAKGEDGAEDDPSSDRFITAFGRDVDVPESKLGYDFTTRRLTLVGGSRRDQKTESALEAVLAVVEKATEPISGRDIEAALKGGEHSRDSVRKAVRLGAKRRDLIEGPGGKGGGVVYARGEQTDDPGF